MLKIIIPGCEFYDERTGEFIYYSQEELQLEHSLESVSKWESKWNKPFLSSSNKSVEEIIDYIRCMTITENVDPLAYERLTEHNIIDINSYIDAPMTATTFNETNKGGGREIITSEIIYYWMISFNIPFECQHWHLNRLLALIKVCNIKNNPPKKMSKEEIMARNKALNAQRKQNLNTKG